MVLPTKILEGIAFNTRPKLKENVLIVMDKATHEGFSSWPLQTNDTQYEIAVFLQTGDNGFLNVTDRNNNFQWKRSSNDDDLNVITIPRGPRNS